MNNQVQWPVMRRKAFSIFILCTLGTVLCSGKLYLSNTNNDLYVGVCGHSVSVVEILRTNTAWITNVAPIRYDDGLVLMGFCRTNDISLLSPINEDYFIRFQMFDWNGKPVVKTLKGGKWGNQFDGLENALKEHFRKVMNQMTIWGAQGPHTNWSPLHSMAPFRLPSPKDLFEIEKSGLYDLKLEVHLLRQHMTTNGWTWDLVTIPPFTVKVEKPL
jgi:hypothetical protein